jgi:hypothetical protein
MRLGASRQSQRVSLPRVSPTKVRMCSPRNTRPLLQIERKWPASRDYFSFGEEAIAFLAGSRARGALVPGSVEWSGLPSWAP